ncbi:GGDEF domain-containing protein [Ectothiorhodospira sp. 9100]|uniref:GGDEF domain-containing protein n=1 Tax=unclassified Ectothiorhodospira TaxID=2684909 RepID=UPI001EE808CB|nr:diguanylate cyclase [Ectothiorhodospira sp. 9100]MCG5518447.1 diguanylate cyclase [Ectothiorhodospira sp. 9905]
MSTDEVRRRCLDTIRELEQALDDQAALEASLRRLLNRLCMAAEGACPHLDPILNRLQVDVSSQETLTPAQLEAYLSELSDWLHDRGRGAHHPAAHGHSGDAAEIRSLGLQLLMELASLPRLQDAMDRLRQELHVSERVPPWSEWVSRVAQAVHQCLSDLHNQREEMEDFLQDITRELASFDDYLAGQGDHLRDSQRNRETFRDHLAQEMSLLNSGLSDRDLELGHLKELVRGRIRAIGQHMETYRGQEALRDQEARLETERLRQRVADLERQSAQLREAFLWQQNRAHQDSLSGLPNREAFDERIRDELSRWARLGTPLSLVVWDIDHFKRVNDTYGHSAGDRVITTVAQCLKERSRCTDMVARYGGEEYVMILVGTPAADALAFCDSLREAVAGLGFHFDGDPVDITLSAGVAEARVGDTPSSLFDRADKALYQAKHRGRNCCVQG